MHEKLEGGSRSTTTAAPLAFLHDSDFPNIQNCAFVNHSLRGIADEEHSRAEHDGALVETGADRTRELSRESSIRRSAGSANEPSKPVLIFPKHETNKY